MRFCREIRPPQRLVRRKERYMIDTEFCEHDTTEVEVEEFATSSASNEYKSTSEAIEVCLNCKIWRFYSDDDSETFDWNYS